MDSHVHVHVYSLIFPTLHRNLDIEAGASVRDMLLHIGIPANAAPYLCVAFQGFSLPEDQWARVRPKAGTHLQVGVAPAGDGGGPNKEGMRVAGVIASVLAGNLIPGALGLSGIAAGLLQAAITYAGYLATITLLPYTNATPPTSNSLTSARNQGRQYGVIPTVHGHMRVVPPLAAAPETEIRGEDHYIQLLLCLGYKPLKVDMSTLKIGETPISQFQGVTTQLSDGWTNHDEITWFSGDINEEFMDRRIGYAAAWRFNLDGVPIPPESTAESTIAPGVVSMTTPSNTAKISIDLTFPDGIGHKNGSSGIDPYAVNMELQYRPSGSTLETAWISLIPTGPDVEQFIFVETNQRTRAQFVAWMVELTAMISDLINAAEFTGDEFRNVPEDLYGLINSRATSIADDIDSMAYSSTPLLGELDVRANLKFQADRLTELCKSVLRQINPAGPFYPPFITAFSALTNPVLAAMWVVAIRNVMADSDTIPVTSSEALKNFLSISATLPTIFETYPTHYFNVVATEGRAGVVRRNITFTVPEGKWDVRLRKTTPDHDDDETYLDEVHVTVFRCHRVAPTISDQMRGSLALLAVDVLATDQLTGSLDQLSVEVERPVYYSPDGETWQGPALKDGDGNNVSRNPAWVMADILTQPPATSPVPFTRLDGDNIKAFADFCAASNFHFDRTFDSRGTVYRALQDVCAVAKGSPTLRDGRYAVVWDRPQPTPRAVISLANANGFEGGKTLQARAQALRIKFKNPAKDWADDELHVYDDGYGEQGRLVYHNEVARAATTGALSMATRYEDVSRLFDIGDQVDLNLNNYRIGINTLGTKTVIIPRSSTYNFREGGNYTVIGHVVTATPTRVEEINLPGIVDVPNDQNHPYHSNQVYKIGRYLLAVAKLRPEVFKARLDFENLVFERGDRVEVQMDTVLWGLGSSRIKSLTRVVGGPNNGKIATVTLEQDLALLDGTKYAVRLRTASNNISGEATFIYDSAEAETITFEVPFNDASHPIARGDLAAWGEPSKATISCLVQEIRPQRDMSAEVTLIQYSPGVYEAENGPIPEFDPGISIPPHPENQRPPAPAIVKVTTDESVLERDTDGSYASRIVIDLRLPQGSTRAERDAAARVDAIHVQFRRSLDAPSYYKPEWIRSGVYARDVTRVSIRDVEDGNKYDVRIRAVTKVGVPSLWSEIPNVFVEGKLTPPPSVTNLRWEDWYLRWDYAPPFDHAGFRVKIHAGGGGGWDMARPAHDGLLLEPRFYIARHYANNVEYHVKAVDTSGVESLRSVFVTRGDGKLLDCVEIHSSTPESFTTATISGSQAAMPFYKAIGSIARYGVGSDPFYQRVYDEDIRGPLATSSSDGFLVQPYPGTHWAIDEYVEGGTTWWYEGKSPDQPFWPEDLYDDLWPASLEMNLFPSFLDWEILHDRIPWYEGVSAAARIVIPALNDPTTVAFYLKLLAPKVIEETTCTISATSGSGDRATLKKYFNGIETVKATVRTGATAAYAKVGATTWDHGVHGDYYGPEIFLYDKDGNRVTGSVDVTVIGY